MDNLLWLFGALAIYFLWLYITERRFRIQAEMAKPVQLGPVVTIRSEDRGEGLFCNTNCDFSSKYLCIHQTGHSASRSVYYPTDTCPKPAPEGHKWRLALFAKEEG